MSADHYVSKFHLREFQDPASLTTPDPWVWLGDLTTGAVKRRSPKKVATAPDLFAGPGGLSETGATIESYLAKEIESRAAAILRTLCATTTWDGGNLPPELMRYLAWAASRSVVMQRLELTWAARSLHLGPSVEPPPQGLMNASVRVRPVRLIHPTLGVRTISETEDPTALFDAGWLPDPTERANFLEGVHVQAYYFQTRWFPRLRWFTLRPPVGSFFVIGDRPVGWGVPDCLDAPPACLRDPSAFLIAPLGRSLALVGRNHPEAWSVTPEQVNAVLAAWSHKWIAGPTHRSVAEAIRQRHSVWQPPN